MKSRFLSRRTFLRGAFAGGAVTLGLPLFDAMRDSSGAVAGTNSLPSRFVVFFWGNGNIPGEWAPANTGPGWEPTPLLRGIADYRDKVHVISGTSLPVLGQLNPHVEGAVGILSGTNAIRAPGSGNSWDFMTVGGPSIDELAADIVGPTSHRSIVLALTTLRPSFGPGTAITYTSHRGPFFFNPPMYEPQELFEMLFAGGAPVFGDPDKVALARKSVLDVVLEDAHSLKGRLGGPDRQRLELHLDSIRQLETRLEGTFHDACVTPDTPQTSSSVRERARRLSELVALAFACDLTRVAAIELSSPASHVDYPDVHPDGLLLNGEPSDFHNYEHLMGPDDTTREVISYFVDLYGDFLGVLDATPESDSSLLDNSVVLGTSELGAGWNHKFDDFPILIAGGGNGRLLPGRHVRLSGDNAGRGLLTCLHALGDGPASWGSEQFLVTDPISEILSG